MTTPSGADDIAGAVSAVCGAGGELRAGGTDVTARRRVGRATGPFVDLRGVAGLSGIVRRPDGSVRVGAMTTLAEVAGDPGLRRSHPALASAAAALATPQIRAAATIGGNLLQRNRCWYYRNAHFSCHQTGGDTCPARTGLNLYSVVIDRSPCVAPHPSSIATALLAYDAGVTAHGSGTLTVHDLYGDGSDPSRDHLLPGGDVLLAVDLPAPAAADRAAHHRSTGRSRAEWPLVEVVARLGVTGTAITSATVAAGGVARTPVRLAAVETALVGRTATPEVLATAAGHAGAGCTPLAQNGYKVPLLCATVLEVLERALGAPVRPRGSGAPATGDRAADAGPEAYAGFRRDV
ncbi:FAD binding domain-containing protein [Streptomyces beigongshangae]|uniref:FAD binding domain-containing protein n=1 Tax=Streptomyces beigongshangae TaxID=2841597 RepID=UPI001C858B25|nr:FAD binding domain-containing protein [Streptomyces sp. REN17]